MKRAIIWSIAGGTLLAAAAALVIAAPERERGPVFIEGSRPVTEEQAGRSSCPTGGPTFRLYGADGSSWRWAPKTDEPTHSQSMLSQGGCVATATTMTMIRIEQQRI